MRPVRIDTLQVNPVGRKAELAELLRLIDDQLIDADLLDRQHVVAPGLQGLKALLQLLLHGLDALARRAVIGVGAELDRLVHGNLVLDQPLLER